MTFGKKLQEFFVRVFHWFSLKNWISPRLMAIKAKRASDVMTQTRLRKQTGMVNDFVDFLEAGVPGCLPFVRIHWLCRPLNNGKGFFPKWANQPNEMALTICKPISRNCFRLMRETDSLANDTEISAVLRRDFRRSLVSGLERGLISPRDSKNSGNLG